MWRSSSSARTAWVVSLESKISRAGSCAGDGFPVVCERDDLAVLGGLGEIGVGVQQGVGAGVFGEEGEHRAGALGAGRHVVAFQRGVLAPVHDGVEVQVQCLAGGQPGSQRGLVEGGQERRLPAVLEPVGVGGQGGGLGQRGQGGEQRGAGVGGDVIDVRYPAGGGELERQQRQHIRQGRDVRGGRVARRSDHVRDAEGDQVRDCEQQPGQAGLGALGQRAEVQGLGAGLDLPGYPAPVGVGAAPEPGQAFGGDHLSDPGPVQRGALRRQRGGDLVDGMPGGA